MIAASPKKTDSGVGQETVRSRKRSLAPSQFIENCIKRVLQNAEGRRYRNVRECCEQQLAYIKECRHNNQDIKDADAVFLPFKLALDSSFTNLMAVSLDCIHQLIAAKLLPGRLPTDASLYPPSDPNNRPTRLIDVIIKSVFEAADVSDDLVQLQVLKALLTAVGSAECEVHEHSLMSAVKACYHVFLSTRNLVNQTTARASLTQMLSIVFGKMERVSQQLADLPKQVKQDISEEVAQKEPDLVVPQIGDRGKFGWCVICGKTADHYCLQTQDSVCSTLCKHANLSERLAKETQATGNDPHTTLSIQAQLLQNDAFLIFRALCKLSGKTPSSPSDMIASKSKTLSLELLLSILDAAGPTFCTGKRFVSAVREYLVQSLLNNCVSTDHDVFRLSLAIFASLIRNFKVQLKNQIGVFLDKIFLRIGAYSNSTFTQRLLVLQVFSKMCQDPETIIGIFANYDCDPESTDIFGNMIMALDRITKDKYQTEGYISEEQKGQLKIIAVQCLVSILGSIHQWHVEHLNSIQAEAEVYEGDEDMEKLMKSEDVLEAISEIPTPPIGIPPSPSGSSEKTTNLSAQYEQQRKLKENLSIGIVKFNIKPKKGIEYLCSHSLLEESEEEIAKFFLKTKGLSKEMVGEYFGQDKEFNQSVLQCYLKLFDFKEMSLDQAMRYFFTKFRVPKETQQIDRIMEKFAGEYCLANPEAFATADIAYVLTYAILMLNTDAHNPQVKNKMTKESFIRTYKQIDEEFRIESHVLESIFDRILSNEIRMTDDLSTPSSSNVSSQQRKYLFTKEIQDMLQQSNDLIKNEKDKSSFEPVYLSSDHIDGQALRTMFEICWPPALATFSILLQESSEMSVIHKCLEGYRFAIKISSTFGLPVQKHAFVNSLAGFTLLGTVNEMRDKNIEAIKVLLTIAFHEGNTLRESWSQVLRCISECERLQLIGSGVHSDAAVFSQSPRKSKRMSKTENESKNSHSLSMGIENNLIDRVFTQSASLNSEAIIDFVENLCAISRMELEQPNSPRIFCLQKIVEITYYNMGRIRLVWSRIWQILAKHFEFAGKHTNKNISMYAIDSLRQLSSKFLEKDELANFHFQKQFLRPFEVMVSHPSWEIREFVLQCLTSLVLARVRNVKSGWRVVFSIFSKTASESIEKLVVLTWNIVETLLRDYPELLVESLDECISCLISFANNEFSEISLQAIGALQKLSKPLDKHYKLCQGTPVKGQDAVDSSTNPHVKVWFFLLTGLSGLASDQRIEVRTRALSVLVNILRTYGKGFDQEIWDLIFRGVLFPIFDDVDHISEQAFIESRSEITGQDSRRSISIHSDIDIVSENSWVRTTCSQALDMLTELFEEYFTHLQSVLPDMLGLFMRCILQPNEYLMRISIECWVRLGLENGPDFSDDIWTMFLTHFQRAISENLPEELFSDAMLSSLKLLKPMDFKQDLPEPYHNEITEFVPLPFRSSESIHPKLMVYDRTAIKVKCLTQDLLSKGLFEISNKFFYHFTTAQRKLVFDGLLSVTRFSQRVNNSLSLRLKLHEGGFLLDSADTLTIPHLYSLESNALKYYLSILFGNPDQVEIARLKNAVLVLFKRFLALESEKDKIKDCLVEQQLKEPIVCFVLESFLGMEDMFTEHFLELFLDFFSSAICADSISVRRLLQQIFEKHRMEQELRPVFIKRQLKKRKSFRPVSGDEVVHVHGQSDMEEHVEGFHAEDEYDPMYPNDYEVCKRALEYQEMRRKVLEQSKALDQVFAESAPVDMDISGEQAYQHRLSLSRQNSNAFPSRNAN